MKANLVCDNCQKEQKSKKDWFYIGPNPYMQEMCKTDREVAELPDEVLCKDCYEDCLGDI